MPVRDIYSKRRARELGQLPDVFTYDDIPRRLRQQVVHILRATLPADSAVAEGEYEDIYDALCREYGVASIGEPSRYRDTRMRRVLSALLSTNSPETALDIIELAFQSAERKAQGKLKGGSQPGPDAVAELNQRFRENGVGYEFKSGQILLVDSQLVHDSVVKPALVFLQRPTYRGANEEFLSAHDHYRHGNTKECLVDCLKAFESTMKAICAKGGWAHSTTDTAKKLLEVCFANGLIPPEMQSHFTSLRASLESGVPTVRK